MAALFRFLPYLWLAFALLLLFPFISTLANADRIRGDLSTDEASFLFGTLTVLLAAMAAFLVAGVTIGLLILRRRGWRVCLILSGALCLAFPIGTALGLVTLVVLTRAEIKARYAA